MTRSAATIFTSLMICTGPLFTPGQLTRRLAPAARKYGYGMFEGRQPLVFSCPPIHIFSVASVLLTFPNRSWVSRSPLLYQGSQYVLSNSPSGNPIISVKLVGSPLTL